MFKTALGISLSLFLFAPAFASPGFHFLHSEHVKKNEPMKATASTTKSSVTAEELNYTDFSGQWAGTCSFSDDDYHYPTNITIMNNYLSFTLNDDEGYKETYTIDSLSSSSDNDTAHFLKHKIAHWVDGNSKLMFNEIFIEANPLDSLFSTDMLETTFSLQNNQLMVHNETHSFFGSVEYRDYSVICTLSKKV